MQPTAVAGRCWHHPTHPSARLRAAKTLGVSRQALHAILAEQAGVTRERAVQLGKLCGTPAWPVAADAAGA